MTIWSRDAMNGVCGSCQCVYDLTTVPIAIYFWQVSVSLCKDEPDTPLLTLMKKEGVNRIRTVLGGYVEYLKTGESGTFMLCNMKIIIIVL